ncbi:MAG: cysteine hydrolase [Betaproteobacteria bacterium]|nr:cysteine hydrolase [Betaproteobacteria bacterium]
MKTALLVIDVQQLLCTGQWACHDIDAVVDRINALVARARAAGQPVIYIQHEEPESPLAHGTPGWQLYARLEAKADDIRIRKTTPDSFLRTELDAKLKSLGADSVVICGLQSEYCVDSTARGALSRGYPVTLAADAHSTMDNGVLKAAEISAHHNATLAGMSSFGPRVTVTPAAQIALEPAPARA